MYTCPATCLIVHVCYPFPLNVVRQENTGNAAFLVCLTSKMALEKEIHWTKKNNVVGAMLMQYNSHHCWMKGSMQTRLINTQIWTFSIIMVVNVFSSFAIWKIPALKMLWQDKKKSRKGRRGEEKKTEISGFVEYLATLAPDPGLFLGFTCVQGNVSHVSTLFWLLLSTQWVVGLGHGTLDRGGPGSAFTSAGQEADSFAVEQPAPWAGVLDFRQVELNSIGTLPIINAL